MTNSTAIALATVTPRHDKNDAPQDVGVASNQLTLGPAPVPKPKPTTAKLRDALDAFNIRGTCRLVAYELLTYYQPAGRVFPSVQTIADGLGLTPRVVQRHLARLERISLWVRLARVGRTNLFELRLPGPVTVVSGGGERSVTPGVNVRSPRSNHSEVTKKNVQRKHCATCGHSWPAEFGPDCFKCLKDPPRPLPAPERPKTALTEASEDQLRAVGWHKGKEGAWSRVAWQS